MDCSISQMERIARLSSYHFALSHSDMKRSTGKQTGHYRQTIRFYSRLFVYRDKKKRKKKQKEKMLN
jgi:hypothetical protein